MTTQNLMNRFTYRQTHTHSDIMNDKEKLKEIRKLIRDCSHTQKYQSKNTGKFVDGDEASYLVYEIQNILES